MLTVDEYIKKRKTKDGIDEFSAADRISNMGCCINYVVEYYEKYLDPAKVDLQNENKI